MLELTRPEQEDVVAPLEAALAAARAEATDLRHRLEAAEADRAAAIAGLRAERERRTSSEDANRRLRERLDRTRGGDAEDADPVRQFIDEVHAAWERTTPPADRERYPWRKPTIGPDFLASLTRVQGVRSAKVIEVCAHVCSGRAREIPGLELHPLRQSAAGGSPQREREDGARAWRCSLQAGTPAARRLHFWRLPDGRGVELARVTYHDDMSIV